MCDERVRVRPHSATAFGSMLVGPVSKRSAYFAPSERYSTAVGRSSVERTAGAKFKNCATPHGEV